MERRNMADTERIAVGAIDVTLITLPLSGEVAEWPKALAC